MRKQRKARRAMHAQLVASGRRTMFVVPDEVMKSCDLRVGDFVTVQPSVGAFIVTRKRPAKSAAEVAMALVLRPDGVTRLGVFLAVNERFRDHRADDVLAAIDRFVADGLAYTTGEGRALRYWAVEDDPAAPRRVSRRRKPRTRKAR
jgi:hypothetical protein